MESNYPLLFSTKCRDHSDLRFWSLRVDSFNAFFIDILPLRLGYNRLIWPFNEVVKQRKHAIIHLALLFHGAITNPGFGNFLRARLLKPIAVCNDSTVEWATKLLRRAPLLLRLSIHFIYLSRVTKWSQNTFRTCFDHNMSRAILEKPFSGRASVFGPLICHVTTWSKSNRNDQEQILVVFGDFLPDDFATFYD